MDAKTKEIIRKRKWRQTRKDLFWNFVNVLVWFAILAAVIWAHHQVSIDTNRAGCAVYGLQEDCETKLLTNN